MPSTYDLIFKNATVIDGSGGPRRRTSVAVSGSSIASIGEIPDQAAAEVLDIAGNVLAPGFIDPHGHSDLTLLAEPSGISKTMQGVTTEVFGNCGQAAAPVTELNRQETGLKRVLLSGGDDLGLTWSSMGEYTERLGAEGLGLNVLPLAGHSEIRSGAMGYEERAPSPDELERMRNLLREALDAGALGMSTGLIFPPSAYADTEEIIELAKILAEHGAMYFSHIRGEDERLLTAIREAISIGERSGAPVQIAHFKAFQSPNWGSVRDGLRLVDDAVERGVNVAVDVYPYVAGMGTLTQPVPDWAQEGGKEEMVRRMKDPATRRRIESELRDARWEWDRSIIARMVTRDEGGEFGMSIAEVAAERGVEPEAAAVDLLIREGGQVSIVCYGMDEADVRYTLQHPASMVCSDALAVTPDHSLGSGLSHPRFYGTFPRVLGHYARDEGLFSMEEAVHRMTGKTADRLGLAQKGKIETGRDADVVVFDEDEIIDRSTFEDPHQYPAGIEHVMVRGRFVVRDGRPTDQLPGQVLQRPDGIPTGRLT